jgi:hypothetical protein
VGGAATRPAPRLRLICVHTMKHALRSGSGLVYSLLALFFGLIVANAVISPFEMMVRQAELAGQADAAAEVEQGITNFARPIVEWAIVRGNTDDVTPATSEWVDFLLDGRPAMLSAMFFVLLFGTPLLIPYGGFNQTSGDIGNRGLRYLLLRTERANIYYGRLFATMIMAAGVQVLVIGTIALYMGLKVQIYDGAAIATWSLQALFALVIVTLPYVAVCAWLSASNDSPMVSLVVSNAVIGGVLLGAFLLQLRWDGGHWVAWLLPWGVQKQLFRPELSVVLLAAGACMLYTVFYAWLGARKFAARDL